MLKKLTKLVNGNTNLIFTLRKMIAKIDPTIFISYKTKSKKCSNYRARFEDDRPGNKAGFKIRLFHTAANKYP